MRKLSTTILAFVVALTSHGANAPGVFIRINQVGYPIQAPKLAIAFSESSLPTRFELIDRSTNVVFRGGTAPVTNATWGDFAHHTELDFTAFRQPGQYRVRMGDAISHYFEVSPAPMAALPSQMLEFMRQQRCGYNPWLDVVCHPFDSRTAYGPLTNGSYLDALGGWHDAGDLLKYLLTSGNATAQLLLAYQLGSADLAQGVGADRVNGLGQAGGNGIPDLLDEARWGLQWMLKLHPAPEQLYHQVADDRDHIGRRLPHEEIADYGWGKGGYRVVYCADGRPQGLQSYKSESTGLANLAGRYAAAMALAYQVWKDDPGQRGFALQCLKAGQEVYTLGRAKEGVQQGNSFRAPYRYEEATWADDMEWGAAELFRATGQGQYRKDAIRYAELSGADSWMGKDQARHYQYYPFMNIGHFRLYHLVDRTTRRKLAGYYREGIEKCAATAQANPYRAGVPFIWCSANLSVALATQCLMYERMTGEREYRKFAAQQYDWLLGRNPWGYSLITGVGAVFPKHPHLLTTLLTGRSIRGGLVDGPVYERIFKSLKGVSISEPDALAAFQGAAVFHDDFQDYSSNEPTMDGTASAILLWALCNSQYSQ